MEGFITYLKNDYFSFDVNKQLFKLIKKYYNKYKCSINEQILIIQIQKLTDRILRLSIVQKLSTVIDIKLQPKQVQYIKSNILQFVKIRQLQDALLQSNYILKHQTISSSNYDKIRSLIHDALQISTDDNKGSQYVQTLDTRYQELHRHPIPTCWQVINNYMNGGLGGGQLGVVMAPSGIGKSWALANLGCHAIKLGKRVVHYTLQLSQEYTNRRYDTILTGISFTDLALHRQIIRQKIEPFKDKLLTKLFPCSITTTAQIDRHLQHIHKQFKPDLIIIDYASLLRSAYYNNRQSVYQMQGSLFQELRGISQKYDTPIWTAEQTNRQGHQNDINDLNSVGQSYKKVQVADFVMSINRSIYDSANNTGKAFIGKNRFGRDKVVFPMQIDLNHGQMQIIDANTRMGKQIMSQMQNKTKQLKQLYKAQIGNLN